MSPDPPLPTFAGFTLLGELPPLSPGRRFHATRPTHPHPVELIRIRADELAEPITTFLTRLQSLVELTHPNLVSPLEVGTAEGDVYVVLPPTPGPTLAEAGPISREKASEFGPQLTQALAAVHERGLTHGAIAPSTIYLTETGAKLAGVGLTSPDQATREADSHALADTLQATTQSGETLADLVDAALAGAPDTDPKSVSTVSEVWVLPAATQSTDSDEATLRPAPASPPPTPQKRTLWIWISLAVGLQLLAIGLWLVYLYRPFATAAPPTPIKRTR